MKNEEGGVSLPDGSVTPMTTQPTIDDATLSWRERRRARVVGDKVLVVCIRPNGEPGWLYLERLEDIEDYLLEGEEGDEWELKWVLMTRAEIDALPEHPGW